MKSAAAIFMSRTEAITCLPLCGCEEKNGRSKGVQRKHPVAAAVGEKAHLGTKRS